MMITKPAFAPVLASAVASLALVLACGVTAAAAAEELSSKELKKLDRDAGKAVKAGRTEQAAELYQQLLDATTAGNDRRQEALWVVAMTRLASDPGDEAGRGFLQELEDSFPRHPHQLELAALQAALAALDGVRAEIDGVRAELAEQQEAFAAERLRIEEKVAGESEEADERVRELEDQLRRVRGELAATRKELEKKEEALQRLLKLRSERGSG